MLTTELMLLNWLEMIISHDLYVEVKLAQLCGVKNILIPRPLAKSPNICCDLYSLEQTI